MRAPRGQPSRRSSYVNSEALLSSQRLQLVRRGSRLCHRWGIGSVRALLSTSGHRHTNAGCARRLAGGFIKRDFSSFFWSTSNRARSQPSTPTRCSIPCFSTLLVEVTSDSTEDYDHGEKPGHCRQIQSLQRRCSCPIVGRKLEGVALDTKQAQPPRMLHRFIAQACRQQGRPSLPPSIVTEEPG